MHIDPAELSAAENYKLLVMFHVADHLLGPRYHIDNFAPIGRLGAPSVYCRTTDRFDVERITFAKWQGDNAR
jgi:hypothetical protein